MKKSRKNIALKNALVSSLMQIINLILGFINHTFFVKLLNLEYLGVNGLYNNIISVLSFAELGIGNAFTFSLYKPIAQNDKEKIQNLLFQFKKIYKKIGIAIMILAILFIPFLNSLIGANSIKENLVLIYIIFAINTSITYFFSYKITFLIANQENYIIQIYTRIFQLILIIVQIIVLYFTRSFTLYVLLQLISTIILNLFLCKKIEKKYPFIKEKNNTKLKENDIKEINNNIKALFFYRIGSISLNSTDNIIISILINVKTVGICSTYTLIIQQITKIAGLAINSITPTIGNLSTEENKEKNFKVISLLQFLCTWIYGFIGIMFIILINDFIYLWLGENYVLSIYIVMSIVFSIYINGVQYPAYAFRNAQGLFKESKYVPLLASIINIVLSLWLGIKIGLVGIFLATGISRLLTTTIIDPILVYKYNFQKKPWIYYLNYIKGIIIVIINLIINIFIYKFIIVSNWLIFILKLILCFITTNLIFIAIYRKKGHLKFILKYIKSIIFRKEKYEKKV